MITMDDKLFGNKIIFPSLKSLHMCIKLLVIGGKIMKRSIEFLTKVRNK